MTLDELIGKTFAGPLNSGLRAKIRGVLSTPVSELWPVPHAERVRNLSKSIAFTGQGRAGLEAIAKAVEVKS